MHRRDRVLQSLATASWQDDALAAVPFSWVFSAREVLRAVLGREPSFVLYVAVAIGGVAPLWLVWRNVRRRWHVSHQP
jgi:hypothetical protein